MGQYRIWLHHRSIDQHLRIQQTTCEQELLAIDEHIAYIEKTTPSTNNVLLTMLMQQLDPQKQTTSKVADITGTQLEPSEVLQANIYQLNYQTPPPSNYGQQGSDLQTTDPRPARQFQTISRGLLAWGHLPNFTAQDLHVPAEQPADANPVLPAAADQLLPNDLLPLLEPQPQDNAQLPWWLRNLMQSSPAEQEPPLLPLTDQPDEDDYSQTNPRAGLWFVHRTKLVHYDE